MATPSSLRPGTVYRCSYNTTKNRYSTNWIDCSDSIHSIDDNHNAFMLPLELGGTIYIYPKLVDHDECRNVTSEILTYHHPTTKESLLRQYRLRNNDEPRLHCLLHRLATTSTPSNNDSATTAIDDDRNNPPIQSRAQPGYKYGSITLKGRSMDDLPLPRTQQLTSRMETLYIEQQRHIRNNLRCNNCSNSDDDNTNDDHHNYDKSNFGPNNEDTIFNIGVEVVFYRNGSDSIGFHADNDQGESFILATIIRQNQLQQPTRKQTRSIVIQPINSKVETEISNNCSNDDVTTGNYPESSGMISIVVNCKQTDNHYPPKYKIILCEGDAYSMDGTMQKFYEHGVPKCLDNKQTAKLHTEDDNTNNNNNYNYYRKERHNLHGNVNHQRMVLIFRRGTMKHYTKDSGQPVLINDLQLGRNTNSQDIGCIFGSIPGLYESELYSRFYLKKIGAHVLDRNSVSGNGKYGCTAIIVSGLQYGEFSDDTFYTLKHCCNYRQGAKAMHTSYRTKLPIRVFRKVIHDKEMNGCFYRYDGLYYQSNVPELVDEDQKIYAFYLEKL